MIQSCVNPQEFQLWQFWRLNALTTFSKWSTLLDTEPKSGNEISLADFYGVKVDELKTEKGQLRIQDADLYFISADDPPLTLTTQCVAEK